MKHFLLLCMCIVTTYVTNSQIVVDTTKLKSDIVKILLQYQYSTPSTTTPPVITNPTTPPITTTPTSSKIVDLVNAYYTSDNVELAGITVEKIKAIKGVDLKYVGLAIPTLDKPYLANGEVVFTNQPLANYKNQTRENNNPFARPEEMTIVFRKMPGTDWEALISGWGNPYIGFGGGRIRAGNPDSYLSVAAFPKFYELSYIHAKFESNGVSIWLNGTYLGKTNTTNVYARMAYGVGIETNSTDFNWKATMYIEKNMTDVERANYFKVIESTYAIGTIPDLPYASDIYKTSKNGKLYASYKYNGKVAEDKSKTEYKWYKLSPDLGKQILIGTTDNITNQSGVKVCVKVYDMNGKSWMFISGNY